MRRHPFNPHPAQYVIDFSSDFPDPEGGAASGAPTASAAPARTGGDDGEPPEPNLFRFISLGSGSSGNACYVGCNRGGLLIDAGIRPETIQQTLLANGLRMTDVKGILLTHDHHDHMQHVYKLLRTNKHLRLFCTNRVMNGLLNRHNVSKRIRDYHVAIYKEIPFSILDMEITAFEVPHDGTDNMGFSLQLAGRRLTLATDLGAVTSRARHYMERANYLVIEANYDSRMLANGRYPEYLKARIRADRGHMDNADTAAFLAEIAGPQLRYVFLCHLSRDNNTPELALAAVGDALRARGLTIGTDAETLADRRADIILSTLPRFDATRLYIFR